MSMAPLQQKITSTIDCLLQNPCIAWQCPLSEYGGFPLRYAMSAQEQTLWQTGALVIRGVLMRRAVIALTVAFCGSNAAGQVLVGKSSGQDLYLPIYSNVWHGEMSKQNVPDKTLVSVSVSVRNTDPTMPIRILSAKYFDTRGQSLREYVSSPLTIGPMGTFELFVPRSDDTGGSGANFVIRWKSEKPTNPPIVQGFHANLPVGRSIAFITSAVVMPVE